MNRKDLNVVTWGEMKAVEPIKDNFMHTPYTTRSLAKYIIGSWMIIRHLRSS